MKTLLRFVLTAVLMVHAITVSAQKELEYQIKIERYKAMAHTGKVLTTVGIPMTAIGTISFVAGEFYYDFDDRSTWDTSDALIYSGAAVGGLGVISLVNGIIFRSIGKRKTGEYQMRLDNLKVGSYCTPNHSGFTLTYSF